jgi:FkbM family methyltransferase
VYNVKCGAQDYERSFVFASMLRAFEAALVVCTCVQTAWAARGMEAKLNASLWGGGHGHSNPTMALNAIAAAMLTCSNRSGSGFPLRSHEPFFNRVIGTLLRGQHLPAGGVIDAGSHTGENTCFYAHLAPERQVTAVEPMASNLVEIAERTRTLRNVHVIHGGLGHRASSLQMSASDVEGKAGGQLEFREMKLATTNQARSTTLTGLQVYRVDDLYEKHRLGFAHFDVEGEELRVLEGAIKTIRRDRPVFTVEIHVHFAHAETIALTRFITRRLGYRILMIEGESCGVRVDCRNLLAVPPDAWAPLTEGIVRYMSNDGVLSSHVHRLVLVNESTIFEFAHPCCKPSGPCCRNGPVPLSLSWTSTNHGYSCCMPKVVDPYYKGLGTSRGR